MTTSSSVSSSSSSHTSTTQTCFSLSIDRSETEETHKRKKEEEESSDTAIKKTHVEKSSSELAQINIRLKSVLNRLWIETNYKPRMTFEQLYDIISKKLDNAASSIDGQKKLTEEMTAESKMQSIKSCIFKSIRLSPEQKTALIEKIEKQPLHIYNFLLLIDQLESVKSYPPSIRKFVEVNQLGILNDDTLKEIQALLPEERSNLNVERQGLVEWATILILKSGLKQESLQTQVNRILDFLETYREKGLDALNLAKWVIEQALILKEDYKSDKVRESLRMLLLIQGISNQEIYKEACVYAKFNQAKVQQLTQRINFSVDEIKEMLIASNIPKKHLALNEYDARKKAIKRFSQGNISTVTFLLDDPNNPHKKAEDLMADGILEIINKNIFESNKVLMGEKESFSTSYLFPRFRGNLIIFDQHKQIEDLWLGLSIKLVLDKNSLNKNFFIVHAEPLGTIHNRS